MRRLALAAFVLLLPLIGLLLPAGELERQARASYEEELSRSLRELHAFATASARRDRRATAFLCFKILEPFRRSGTFRAADMSEQETLLSKMRFEDFSRTEKAEKRIARWLRRHEEPLTSFFLLVLDDPRYDAGRKCILIRLLYLLCPDRLEQPLLEMARRPYDHRQRVALWEAAIHLGRLGGDDAADALRGLTERMENWGRQYPIIALKRMGRLEAVPAIEAALADSCDAVRRHACRALAVLGDRNSIPALEGLLRTETDELARRFAREAIEALRRRPLP